MAIENVFFSISTHAYVYIRKHIGNLYIPHTNIVDKPRYNWRGCEVQGYCVQSILIPISLMNRHVVLFKSFNVSPNDK